MGVGVRMWVGEGKVVGAGRGGVEGCYSLLPVIIFKRLYPQSVSIMVGLVWTQSILYSPPGSSNAYWLLCVRACLCTVLVCVCNKKKWTSKQGITEHRTNKQTRTNKPNCLAEGTSCFRWIHSVPPKSAK